MRSRRAFGISLAAGIVLVAGCVAPVSPSQASPPEQGISGAAARQVVLPTVTPDTAARYPNRGPVPELTNETWLNSAPLRLADLRGKVVLVEFWTFGCINCRNVIPALQEWHARYADDGLVIIGVHTPEFAWEEEVESVRAAAAELGVVWPIAIDSDWVTWRAWNNRYWPAMYLIDKEGNLRHLKIGEGNYTQTEAVIADLLAEGG